jgi:hypothetical protein
VYAFRDGLVGRQEDYLSWREALDAVGLDRAAVLPS